MGLTQIAIAHHLDLSTTKVREYIGKGVIPKDGTLDEIRVAYIRHLRARKGGVTEERARLDAATADLREFDLAKKRGEHVPATDQDQVVIGLATIVSTRLQAVPTRVGPLVAPESDPARCTEIVQEAVDEALHDLAAEGRRSQERIDVDDEVG